MLKKMKLFDYAFLLLALILVGIGIIAIYSSGYADGDNEYVKQIIWLSISFGAMLVFALTNVDFQQQLSYIAYAGLLVTLVAVLFTTPINNATSWFNFGNFTIQPSEFMKIAYILVLSKYISKNIKEINKIKCLTVVVLACLVPVVLIAIQPDFGTAIVFLVITFFMLFKAGLKLKYIAILAILVLIAIPMVYFFVLSEYQQERIQVFLNPELDPLGSGYNALQSKLAIGSGMLFGTGILKGTQTQFGYLPVKSSDFIFSVISEEMGFVVSMLVIVVYVVLLIKILQLSKSVSNTSYSLVLMGIFGMFFFHFVENVGMTIGLLPITGIPLLFVSYGGTSLLTSFISLGIILNISSKRNREIFAQRNGGIN